jgi:hypothetical protein
MISLAAKFEAKLCGELKEHVYRCLLFIADVDVHVARLGNGEP